MEVGGRPEDLVATLWKGPSWRVRHRNGLLHYCVTCSLLKEEKRKDGKGPGGLVHYLRSSRREGEGEYPEVLEEEVDGVRIR